MPVEFTALKCDNCNAPMPPDVTSNVFRCSFCGSEKPFSSIKHRTPVIFRHQPLRIVDGYMKLGHVYHESFAPVMDDFNIRNRWGSTEAAIAFYDYEAFENIAKKGDFTFNCNFCGAEIRGSLTQTMFTCSYCNNITADANVVKSGEYRKRQVIGEHFMIPDWALPFQISPEKAQELMLELAREFEEYFDDVDLYELFDMGKMSAVYMPHALVDLRARVEARTDQGDHWFYLEWFNWALPKHWLFDECLLDELHPWDFGRIETYNPAFLAGDIRIVGANQGWNQMYTAQKILCDKLAREIKVCYDLEKASLGYWSLNLREHHDATVALPIYHMERMGRRGDSDIRIAVNGHTGKAAAVIHKDNQTNYCHLTGFEEPMTPECSMRSFPIPVKYAKSPLLYEKLPWKPKIKNADKKQKEGN